jgi:hypothetical protein
LNHTNEKIFGNKGALVGKIIITKSFELSYYKCDFIITNYWQGTLFDKKLALENQEIFKKNCLSSQTG